MAVYISLAFHDITVVNVRLTMLATKSHFFAVIEDRDESLFMVRWCLLESHIGASFFPRLDSVTIRVTSSSYLTFDGLCLLLLQICVSTFSIPAPTFFV